LLTLVSSILLLPCPLLTLVSSILLLLRPLLTLVSLVLPPPCLNLLWYLLGVLFLAFCFLLCHLPWIVLFFHLVGICVGHH
jgi:hypothetical protein